MINMDFAISTETWRIWLTSAIAGVAFHHGYTRHQEVDFSAWRIITTFHFLILAFWYYYTQSLGQTSHLAAQNASLAGTVFVAATICSMLLYRGLFHRLGHIPGPLLARLSSFYILARVFVGLQTQVDLERLHSKYGDFVRVGQSHPRRLNPSDLQLTFCVQDLVKSPLPEPMLCPMSMVSSKPHSILPSTPLSTLHRLD